MLPLAVVILTISSCTWFANQPDEEVVARVGEHYLYAADLEDIINEENVQDSLEIINAYIDQWIKKELLLLKAEQNLSESQINFEKQLEDYRNSLIIYAYENLLIKQKLDTSVSELEINAYFEANQANFEVKEPLYKALYVSFLNSAPSQDSLSIWFKEQQNFEKLNDYCTRFAKNCQLNPKVWISESEWKDILPLDTNANFGKIEIGFNEFQDSTRTVWVQVEEMRNIGEIAPVNVVVNQIRAIIINQRRIQLLAKVKEEIYEEATLKNRYEIFQK